MTTVRNIFWALALLSFSLAVAPAGTTPVATKGKAPAKAATKTVAKAATKAAPARVPTKAASQARVTNQAAPHTATASRTATPYRAPAARGRVQPQYGRYANNRRPVPNARQKVAYHPAPMVPTPERTKEIQAALAQRGYLNSEPTGAWDADSQAAMKRFQKDQNLDADGKLNSLSLIALGLGPKRTLTASSANPPSPGYTISPSTTNPVPPKP